MPVLTVITTAFCTIASSVITFKIASRQAATEHQRQIRELGFKIAVTNFEMVTKRATAEAAATGQPVDMYSLPVFVAEGLRLAEIIANPRFEAWQVGQGIAGMVDFAAKVHDSAKR